MAVALEPGATAPSPNATPPGAAGGLAALTECARGRPVRAAARARRGREGAGCIAVKADRGRTGAVRDAERASRGRVRAGRDAALAGRGRLLAVSVAALASRG